MKIFKKMKKGFTLVELVVVIAVIAILAAVSVGAYFGVTESANRSKLEQEGKQVQTAIQTISLAGNEHSSLTSNGLVLSNPGEFELALEESLGKEVALTDVQNTKDNTNPTIYFSDVAIQSTLGDKTYKTFEYHLPEINGKMAQVNVVTGEVKVADSTAEGTDVPNAPIAISLEEANRIGSEQGNGKYTTQEYILEGQITNIKQDYYGNVYITSGDATFYIYGLKQGDTQYGDLANKPGLGDYIKVLGTIGKYNDVAQMASAQLLSFTEGELPPVEPTVVTLEEANTIGEAAATPTTEIYSVTGTVVKNDDLEKGKLTISDGTNTLVIFKPTKIVEGNSVTYANMESKPGINDVIVVTGSLSNYNGVAQIENGVVVEHTDNTVEPITNIEDALNAANGYPIVLSGEVTSINEAYNSQYDNIGITLTDSNDKSIIVYRLKGNVNIHQLITITGYMGTHSYNANQRQVAPGATFTGTDFAECKFASATCTTPKTCEICGKTEGAALGCTDSDSDGKCDVCKNFMNQIVKETTIEAYAASNSWANSTKYSEIILGENNEITIVASGTDAHTGKYYTSGQQWRLYYSGSATLTFNAKEGLTINSISVEYDSYKTGVLSLNDEVYESGSSLEVGSNTITLNVMDTDTEDGNGQARVTKISVAYMEVSGNGGDEPEHTDHTFDTTGSCTFEGCTATCSHNWSNKDGECAVCHFICNHTLSAGEECSICGYKDSTTAVTETSTVLDKNISGEALTNTSYKEWSGKIVENVTFAGCTSIYNKGAIQFKSKDSVSGIVVTNNSLKNARVKKIIIEFDTGTQSGRVVDIYGKNAAYSKASDLYNSTAATQGTKLGSITYGTTTELTVTGDYSYIGLRSNSGALYMKTITIVWSHN